jgi:isopropylmalate/homocitrate/citramalate synthase
MAFPRSVQLVEVSPRDGLQNEKEIIPVAVKIELINRLAETGLRVIEAASFVSPKWVPQLADGADVLQGIKKISGVRYPVLVPNLKGFESALAAGAEEVSVFTTPSEQFSQKNTNCSVAESINRLREVITAAKAKSMRVRAYVSCVLGCPYEGNMPAKKVAALAKTVYEMGADEISLGDTIGVGTPFKTREMLEAVRAAGIPVSRLAVHFHDTYGQALANIYAALEMGIAIVDASAAGLGGCPYAKGASGNVATEDVVYMLNGMGIETGVNLQKLVETGRYISMKLGHEPQSRVNRAWKG